MHQNVRIVLLGPDNEPMAERTIAVSEGQGFTDHGTVEFGVGVQAMDARYPMRAIITSWASPSA